MYESYPEKHLEDVTSSDEPAVPAGRADAGQGESTTGQVQQAGQAAEKVQQQAVQQASGQKDRIAQGLESLARALTQTSQQLHDNQQDTVARYADMAADRIRQAADYVGSRDVREIVDEAEDLARRRPALVLGGAFALGLLSVRFLKSSSASQGRTVSGDTGRPARYGNAVVQEGPSPRSGPAMGPGDPGTGVA
ncbi:MAG: hypothetical protein QJR03_11970 [Sphaerobacter sp.]|nr:hypothetical protein [Sphaerobacter sp.]